MPADSAGIFYYCLLLKKLRVGRVDQSGEIRNRWKSSRKKDSLSVTGKYECGFVFRLVVMEVKCKIFFPLLVLEIKDGAGAMYVMVSDIEVELIFRQILYVFVYGRDYKR